MCVWGLRFCLRKPPLFACSQQEVRGREACQSAFVEHATRTPPTSEVACAFPASCFLVDFSTSAARTPTARDALIPRNLLIAAINGFFIISQLRYFTYAFGRVFNLIALCLPRLPFFTFHIVRNGKRKPTVLAILADGP